MVRIRKKKDREPEEKEKKKKSKFGKLKEFKEKVKETVFMEQWDTGKETPEKITEEEMIFKYTAANGTETIPPYTPPPEITIESPEGYWEGRFKDLILYSDEIIRKMQSEPLKHGYPGFSIRDMFVEKENQLKVVVTKKQTNLSEKGVYDAKVKCKFKNVMETPGGPRGKATIWEYSGSTGHNDLTGSLEIVDDDAKGVWKLEAKGNLDFSSKGAKGGFSSGIKFMTTGEFEHHKGSGPISTEVEGKITQKGFALTNILTGILKFKWPKVAKTHHKGMQIIKDKLEFTIYKVSEKLLDIETPIPTTKPIEQPKEEIMIHEPSSHELQETKSEIEPFPWHGWVNQDISQRCWDLLAKAAGEVIIQELLGDFADKLIGVPGVGSGIISALRRTHEDIKEDKKGTLKKNFLMTLKRDLQTLEDVICSTVSTISPVYGKAAVIVYQFGKKLIEYSGEMLEKSLPPEYLVEEAKEMVSMVPPETLAIIAHPWTLSEIVSPKELSDTVKNVIETSPRNELEKKVEYLLSFVPQSSYQKYSEVLEKSLSPKDLVKKAKELALMVSPENLAAVVPPETLGKMISPKVLSDIVKNVIETSTSNELDKIVEFLTLNISQEEMEKLKKQLYGAKLLPPRP